MAKAKLANGTRGKMRDGIRECVGRTGRVSYHIKVPARDAVTGRPSRVWQTFATRTEAKEARDKLRNEHHGRPLIAIPKKASMSVAACSMRTSLAAKELAKRHGRTTKTASRTLKRSSATCGSLI
jgi:hypothetical protein